MKRIDVLKKGIVLAVTACLLSGCSGNTATGTSATAPETTEGSEKETSATEMAGEKKILHAGSSAGMFGATNLDPAVDWNGWFLSFAGIAETLFKLDDAYNAVPTLVESYEEPTDGVTWVFHLRDDVYFSNGEKMTAQSVVDCFNRTLGINNRSESTLNVASMSADGQDLTLVTPFEDPTFIYSLCDPLLTVYYVGESEDYENASHCTGPFVIEQFTPEVEMVLTKNENYWGGDVKIDEAHLITFGDDDAMVMAMQNGELDICDGTSSAVLVCNESTGYNVLSIDTSRAEKIMFNYNDSDFANDGAIREAIAWSVDREGYETISNGTKRANWGIYPATLTYGDNSKLDIHIKEQNLEKAAEVLDDAGYVDTDGDGIREMNGTPISLVMAVTDNASTDFCDVLASDLRSVGIEMRTESYLNLDSFETYNGVNWDMSLSGKYMTPTGNASYFFDQDVVTDGSANYGGYSNPEIDKLADELHKTFGEEKRNELVFKMEQILLDDNSFIVYCNGTNTYITSDRVSGYKPCPSNYYYLDANVDLD
ncbi:peptide/nickel transport system substrate-binding protein [Lachnospiraceae bacterium XPB1003]|nr:peptide/nickel transport system substrate-binding protein [Lachnospiraceae bacterium XPB1003]